MGSCASVAAILQAMEGKYGAVAPLDVMMKKLFSLSQGKTESVTNFAIRLESTLANIQRDHPTHLPKWNIFFKSVIVKTLSKWNIF